MDRAQHRPAYPVLKGAAPAALQVPGQPQRLLAHQHPQQAGALRQAQQVRHLQRRPMQQVAQHVVGQRRQAAQPTPPHHLQRRRRLGGRLGGRLPRCRHRAPRPEAAGRPSEACSSNPQRMRECSEGIRWRRRAAAGGGGGGSVVDTTLIADVLPQSSQQCKCDAPTQLVKRARAGFCASAGRYEPWATPSRRRIYQCDAIDAIVGNRRSLGGRPWAPRRRCHHRRPLPPQRRQRR